MKRIIGFILFVWILLVPVVLTSCGEQTKHDGDAPISNGEASGSETSDREDREDDDGGETEQLDTNFEWVLLPDGTYGISKLLNTSASELTIPESYRGKPITKIL